MANQSFTPVVPESLATRLRDGLHLYSTSTGQKRPFVAQHPPKVSIYICGPTVYSQAHIGNMRTYLFSDLLRRILSFAGYELDAVMNITDVGHLTDDSDDGEEKLAKAAAEERETAWGIAEKYTEAFFRDAGALNITPVQEVARATDHIPQQIALAEQLETKGLLYRTGDGMYLDTSLIPDYGKLTPNDTRKSLHAGVRVAMGEKRHPTDFAVWKFSGDGPRRDMEWPSPWGTGFPGWHLECSAMALEYLGATMDIHVGGIDHIAVHHTNEIAQSESTTGVPLANWWMHGAFLELEGERRMGKSEGNKITLETLRQEGFDPLDFRYNVLQAHYRSPLAFSFDELRSSAASLRNLRRAVQSLRSAADGEPNAAWWTLSYAQGFVDALADDLNLPKALATLWGLARDDAVSAADRLAVVRVADRVLGLDLERAPAAEDVPDDVRQLADDRWTARTDKDFARSDALREELLGKGWVVNDGPNGYELVRNPLMAGQ